MRCDAHFEIFKYIFGDTFAIQTLTQFCQWLFRFQELQGSDKFYVFWIAVETFFKIQFSLKLIGPTNFSLCLSNQLWKIWIRLLRFSITLPKWKPTESLRTLWATCEPEWLWNLFDTIYFEQKSLWFSVNLRCH